MLHVKYQLCRCTLTRYIFTSLPTFQIRTGFAVLLIQSPEEAGIQLGTTLAVSGEVGVCGGWGGQCQICLHATKGLYEQAPRPAKTSSHMRLVKQTIPLSVSPCSRQPATHCSETVLSCSKGTGPFAAKTFWCATVGATQVRIIKLMTVEFHCAPSVWGAWHRACWLTVTAYWDTWGEQGRR